MRNASEQLPVALIAVLLLALLAVGPVVSLVGTAGSRAWRDRVLVLSPRASVPMVTMQATPASCGPAVVSTLLRWAGRPIPEAELLRFTALRADGITLSEFARLADAYDLPGSWYDVARRDLGRLPRPFVAHLRSAGGHFVVVTALDRRFAVVADPARGMVIAPRAGLEQSWSGRAFLFENQSGAS